MTKNLIMIIGWLKLNRFTFRINITIEIAALYSINTNKSNNRTLILKCAISKIDKALKKCLKIWTDKFQRTINFRKILVNKHLYKKKH